MPSAWPEILECPYVDQPHQRTFRVGVSVKDGWVRCPYCRKVVKLSDVEDGHTKLSAQNEATVTDPSLSFAFH